MDIQPIAYFRSPFGTKFGIPRQSGLVEKLEGSIVFEPPYRHPEALRGLEDFDYLWLIWGFSANPENGFSPTVRPPRLRGNVRMGVFATRSPFRRNRLGLSSVKIKKIERNTPEGPMIHVAGGDLMDGTPIYDIKPYIKYADSHPDAHSGFAGSRRWNKLEVKIPETFGERFSPEQIQTIVGILELDPRPHYQDDPQRVYGMTFGGEDIRFKVDGDVLTVL